MERKNYIGIVLWVFLLASALFGGCAGNAEEQKDIVILYTNDVHCTLDENIGYAGLTAYKKHMEEKTPYVTLVDCGDALQGDTAGALSKGEYPAELMKQAGYDFAVPGNHEFDYGVEQLGKLIKKSGAEYLGCNIQYSGKGKNALEEVKPYEIISYGEKKVAFVGICTPGTIIHSTSSRFMDETGQFVYGFCGGEDGEELYKKVQETVDECRKEGADYVIALAHLGDEESAAPFRSIDVIEHTQGIDAVLDGHAHSVIPCRIVENKKGEEVLLSSTGTGLKNIGQLIITAEGNLMTGLISDYPETDREMEKSIQEIQTRFRADMGRLAAESSVFLSVSSDAGIRLVRNRETNLGDFCADAYRAVGKADIALINGGGIRADLKEGDLTYEDILAVAPYGNTLCVAEVSGQEILDALEMACRFTLLECDDGENAVGENGGFLQVSGLQYTIDTSIESTVSVDENDMFLSCGENRRVKDVMVQEADGSFVSLDPAKTYTLASHNYLIKEGGDGLNIFMDNKLKVDEGILDYQVLVTYITDYLGGSIGEEYRKVQGRITVE